MWTEITPSGAVKYKEQYVDPRTGKKRRATVTMPKDTARNRRRAEEILKAKIADPSEPDIDDLTLSQLVDLYREYQRDTVRPSTYTRNYHAMESLKRILGPNVRVNSLTARTVNYRLQLDGGEPGTVNERLVRLKALLRWGYQNDYVQDISWLDKVRKQKDDARAEKLEQKYLEGDELKTLLDAMTVTKWRQLAQLTALSGMRIGEAIALEQKDVDIDARLIHITKTYDAVNAATGYPKTHASYRDVYMQDELLELCKSIAQTMRVQRFHTQTRSKLFMHDVNGNYLDYFAYNKYLKEVSQKVLGRPITSHYMRHTHVALLAEQGIPLDVISRRLGHEDSKVTQEVYFHVTEKLKERDNEKLREVRLM